MIGCVCLYAEMRMGELCGHGVVLSMIGGVVLGKLQWFDVGCTFSAGVERSHCSPVSLSRVS